MLIVDNPMFAIELRRANSRLDGGPPNGYWDAMWGQFSSNWARIGVTAVLLAAVGCSTPAPVLKTPVPETIAVPPEDDARYSNPIDYPKELLNKPPVKPASPNGMPKKDGYKGVGQGF
jgi:hypothetical protein